MGFTPEISSQFQLVRWPCLPPRLELQELKHVCCEAGFPEVGRQDLFARFVLLYLGPKDWWWKRLLSNIPMPKAGGWKVKKINTLRKCLPSTCSGTMMAWSKRNFMENLSAIADSSINSASLKHSMPAKRLWILHWTFPEMTRKIILFQSPDMGLGWSFGP